MSKYESLDDFSVRRLTSLDKRHWRRELRIASRAKDATVNINGYTLKSFACNDYLGLSLHEDVIAASVAATQRSGTGAGASRLISGNHPEYAVLERRLAEIKQTEDAVVFGSGYLANIGIITALMGSRDLICIDELAHSCLRSGAALSGASVVQFRHNDAEDCRRILTQQRPDYEKCLVLTEGVFSMDGDLAPLSELLAISIEHNAWLLCDDAHALGVIGNGRGSAFTGAVPLDIPLQMGTLSKSVGAYGGYLCASKPVCEYVRNRARSFVYSTALPPGTVAAAAHALSIIQNQPQLCGRPLRLAQRFTAQLNLPPAESPIVAIVIGESRSCLNIAQLLDEAGFFVPAIRPPTVPQGTARLRVAFSAAHNENDVDELANAMIEIGAIRKMDGV